MIDSWLTAARTIMKRVWRSGHRHPGLPILLILTAAIGIGSGVGVFAYVDALFFKPLPYRDPGRLVRLSGVQPDIVNIPFSGPDLNDLLARERSFSGIAAYDNYAELDVVVNKELSHFFGAAVSPEFFDFLGVHPFRGQAFRPSDGEGNGNPVAILAYDFWRDQFNGSDSIIGSPIQINGMAFTVVGILPKNFWFPGMQDAKLWVPLSRKPFELNPGDMTERNEHWLKVVARLRPGVTLAQAQSEIAQISAQLEKQYPDSNRDLRWTAEPFRKWMNEDAQGALPGLLAICLLIVGIACANMALLVLLRLATRRTRTATQLALGASPLQVYAEEAGQVFILALIGGILGGLIGYVIVKTVPIQEGDTAPLLQNLSIDYRLLLALIGITLFSSGVASLAAIVGLVRGNWVEDLRMQGPAKVTTSTSRKLQACVACQTAFATIITIGAATLYEDFAKTAALDPGFEAKHVLSLELDLSSSPYAKDETRRQLVQSIMDRVRGLPEVQAAGGTYYLPFGGLHGNGRFSVVGQDDQAGWAGPPAERTVITPQYFQAMRIPLLAGRDFSETDKTEHVVIINSSLARTYFHGADAVGRSLKLEGGTGTYRIVGVVGDTKRVSLNEHPLFYAYLPYQEDPSESIFLVIRSAGNPLLLTETVKGVIRDLASTVPVFDIASMPSRVMQSLDALKFNLAFVGACAVLALLLALIGVYGTVTYAVTARKYEIGIRMAMGAQLFHVILLLAARAFAFVVLGVLSGLVCVPLLRGLLLKWTSHMIPFNSAVLVLVCLAMSLVGLMAALPPIWKIIRINTAQALRMD
jgi:putative ABC transport system permease protein